MPTRRERLRAELTGQIKAAALERLQTHGADGLSLRAVARDVGLSAPGMYRYFDSRDALLTALITEGYEDLADHVIFAVIGSDQPLSDGDRPAPMVPERVPVNAPPAQRFGASARAYRHWSRTHPNEFALLYGTPIPGYAAPTGGPTVDAVRRMSIALLRPLVEAHVVDALRIPESFAADDLGDATALLRADIADLAGMPVPAALPPFLLATWARLHGIVTLEVFNQFAFAFGDDAGDLFEAELASLTAQTFIG
ncbi:MAG TPA: TetR/AcrR family transcriptional regulator [Euzebyales bacterium]